MNLSAAQLNARQALLKRGITRSIENGMPLDSLLAHLIENVEGQSSQMLAAVFLYDPERNDLTVGCAPNLQPIYKKAVNGFKCGPHQPACGSAVFKKQRVICGDVRTDVLWEDLRVFAETIGIRAVWSEPIFSENGSVLGTVAFYHPSPKEPDSTDCLILDTTAKIAALIIEARSDQAKAMVDANMKAEPRHQCLVYDGPPSLQLPLFASVIQKKLAENYRCLYLNSPAMVAGLRSALSAIGVDVSHEVAAKRLIFSSDSPASGHFDPDQMLSLLEGSLKQSLQDGFKGLWASGDMSWEFGNEHNFEKLLEYEFSLERIFRSNDQLCGICQYHKNSLPPEALRDGLRSHQDIFISETLSRANPHFLPVSHKSQVSNEELDAAINGLCRLRDRDRMES